MSSAPKYIQCPYTHISVVPVNTAYDAVYCTEFSLLQYVNLNTTINHSCLALTAVWYYAFCHQYMDTAGSMSWRVQPQLYTVLWGYLGELRHRLV